MLLQWRHNEGNGVSTHRRVDCLLNRLYRRRSKKTSKPQVTGICEGNPSVIGGFPSQRASNAEIVSISWRHHAIQEYHYSDATLALRHLIAPALPMFVHQYVQANSKENRANSKEKVKASQIDGFRSQRASCEDCVYMTWHTWEVKTQRGGHLDTQ